MQVHYSYVDKNIYLSKITGVDICLITVLVYFGNLGVSCFIRRVMLNNINCNIT